MEIVAALLVLALIAQHFVNARALKDERSAAAAREDAHLAQEKHLSDQIVLLKVEPQMAAVQAVPMEAVTPSHLSLSDDEAVAAYEAERARVLADTKAFIEQHTAEPVS